MTKKPLAQTAMSILIGHMRNMVSSPDPLSILVRGTILIDLALEDLIETFSAVPFKKFEESFDHPSLMQKAVIAASLGAISQGELTCIKEINSLRNKLAHRIDVNITQKDEERIVNIFRGQTKLFSGLNYDPANFPKPLIFLLLVLFNLIHLRIARTDAKIAHKQDGSNVESVAAITLTVSMSTIIKTRVEANDAEITKIIEAEVEKAKKLRDEDSQQSN